MAWLIGVLAYLSIIVIICVFFKGCSVPEVEAKEPKFEDYFMQRINVTCQNCERQFEIDVRENITLAELEVFVCNECNHDGSFGEAIHEAERCLE